jgi:hypothetical protein
MVHCHRLSQVFLFIHLSLNFTMRCAVMYVCHETILRLDAALDGMADPSLTMPPPTLPRSPWLPPPHSYCCLRHTGRPFKFYRKPKAPPNIRLPPPS